MAEHLGGYLSKKKVSTYFTYYIMVHEWKELSKGVSALEQDIDKKKRDVHKHNIEDIHQDMRIIDQQIDECEESGYKLGVRNLLLLRKSIWLMRILSRSVKQNLAVIKSELSKLPKQIGGRRVRHAIDKLIHEGQEADEFAAEKVREVVNLAHKEIKGEQRAIFANIALEEGKEGVSLMIKGKAEGMIRKMQIRWGALLNEKKGLRKQGTLNKKVEEYMKRLRNRVDALVKSVLSHHDSLKERDLVKELERDDKLLKDLFKKLKQLFKTIEELIKSSYKVFIFDMILLESVVKALVEQEKYDQNIMIRHEIPQLMGKKDIKELEKDKGNIFEHLQNLRKFLLQLWKFVE